MPRYRATSSTGTGACTMAASCKRSPAFFSSSSVGMGEESPASSGADDRIIRISARAATPARTAPATAPTASSSSPAFPPGEDNSESISTSSAPAISESVCNVGRCLPLSIFAMDPRVRPQRFASSVCESPASRRRSATFRPTRS